ncbi:MAG TPA: hypothetical protein VGO11_14160 [Chthoniobacteraceae bacterium]|jgi:hypothetical protein|nr:hypothetical protein [Chthoniobacteraceae bacterium]
MRGSPILRALVALGILLALGWPLHYLLNASEAGRGGVPLPAPKVEQKRPVHLQVSFTAAPAVLRVLSLGEAVWTETKPALEVERDLTVAYPKEGVELEFQVDWPEGGRNAAKVVLTDPSGAQQTGFVWGSGKTTEVLTFQ